MACKTVFILLVATCMSVSALLPRDQSPQDEECVVDKENHCRAVCGDLRLDISDVFTYPVSVKGSDDLEYEYSFSPCNGISCFLPETTVCQRTVKDNVSYSCGIIDSAKWTLLKTAPLQFSIAYDDDGSEGRKSIVTFNEDPTMDIAKLYFTGEDPQTTYYFAIRGKYVGQQSNGSNCTVDESNSCVATCNGQKFDISSVFNYPTRAIGGDYAYSYSPCAGSMCQNDTSSNSALCQTTLDSKSDYSLGKVSSVEWRLYQSSPYVFTVEYKDGDDGRTSQVKFTQDDNLQSATFTFLEEPMPLRYNFEVRGSNVGQPSGPDICSVDPNNKCSLFCDGKLAVDISDVFRYPVSSSDQGYTYEYNPCNGGSCGCPDPTTSNAICQTPMDPEFTYSCGKVSDVQWTVKRTHPYVFSINYNGGDDISCDGNSGDQSRKSMVTFYEDASVLTPSIKYLGEDPSLEYNFEVRGSYVGQKLNRTSCVVDPRTPCIATCNKTVKIDLSKIISNPITILGPGGENFIFSPCVGYTCGSPAKNSSVCSGDQTSYGQLSTVKWTLTQTKPFFIFTITYTGGDEVTNGSNPRSSTFTFVESTGVDRIVAVYVGELADNSNSYLFDVVGSCIGQPSCSGDEDHAELFPLRAGVFIAIACVLGLMAVITIVLVWTNYRTKRTLERKDAILLNY